MIEVYVEEFATREIPVKIRFRGRLAASLRLKAARTIPERVAVMGYKSRINDVNVVYTEEVDLEAIAASLTRRVALKQTEDILKFRDHQDVELQLEVEARGAKK
jgi:YbbR domain-containing protein